MGRTARRRGGLALLAAAAVLPVAIAAVPGSGSAVEVTAGANSTAATATARTRFVLPAGALRLSTARLDAGAGQQVTFTVELTRRAVADGTLELTLPRVWLARAPASGLAYATVPRGGDGSGRRAEVRREGRVVRFAFRRALRRDSARFTVTDNGIPASTYRVAFRWREAGRGGTRGTASVAVVAGTRPRR